MLLQQHPLTDNLWIYYRRFYSLCLRAQAVEQTSPCQLLGWRAADCVWHLVQYLRLWRDSIGSAQYERSKPFRSKKDQFHSSSGQWTCKESAWLPFTPEVWQSTLIHHIAHNYDSILPTKGLVNGPGKLNGIWHDILVEHIYLILPQITNNSNILE